MYTVASPALSQECALSSTHPTLHGPRQLRITIRGTSISGGPFTVHVLQSPEMQAPTEEITIKDTSISGSPFTVHVLQSPECRRQLRRSRSETLAYQVVPSQFMYYSLLKCRHQLRITIRDISISGSLFTVTVS